jgi:predicted cupin superfamily sugar epimerase
MPNAKALISSLELEPHPEGGFFRRTYQSIAAAPIGPEGKSRRLLSSIFYLLSRDSPIGQLHVNRSDILHFHQGGAPIRYTLVSPSGELSQTILGSDLAKGRTLQLTVPGGWWKASELLEGEADFGLISEAVSPGFEYEDMHFVSKADIDEIHPNLLPELERLCRN